MSALRGVVQAGPIWVRAWWFNQDSLRKACAAAIIASAVLGLAAGFAMQFDSALRLLFAILCAIGIAWNIASISFVIVRLEAQRGS